MKTILFFTFFNLINILGFAQPSFTLDKIYFNKQYIFKVSISTSGNAYVIKGKNKQEVAVANALGQEKNITSLFKAFTNRAFNDIQSTDSNYVFLATDGDYLLRYNGSTIKHLNQEHGLQNGTITSLAGRHLLFFGNNLGLFNSQDQGYTRFAPTYRLNNPTIGMMNTQRAEIFTVDRGVNFQYQHPPIHHYCHDGARFTHYIAPANLHYRTHSFKQGEPDTSLVYTAHHVIPNSFNYGYSYYNMYNYIGTRTGLRKTILNGCEAKVYLPKRRVYKLLELRTLPNEIFNTPDVEQRFLLSATDSGLYINKITEHSFTPDTLQLVPGTEHLQIFDIDTDTCYSKIWLATNKGLFTFSVKHKVAQITQNLTYRGIQNVCFSPSFRIGTLLEKEHTVQWLKDGAPIPGATERFYDATGPGTYRALIKLDCYSTTVASSTVTLLRSELKEIQVTVTGNRLKCESEYVTLETPVRSDYTYQWYRDGEPISEANATQNQLITSAPGNYTVQVSNCYDTSIFSKPIKIQNSDVPRPVLTYKTNRVCMGETVTLQVQNFSGKIDWFLNGEPVTSVEGQPTKLIAKASGPSNLHNGYQVKFSNDSGCSSISDFVTVYFSSTPNLTITQGSPNPVCAGTLQRLQIKSDVFSPIIQWSTGSTSDFILVDKPGKYYVTVKDGNTGCAATDSVDVDFYDAPILNIPTDTTICEANLSNLLIEAGPLDGRYTLNGTAQHSNRISISKAGTYTIGIEDKNGCSLTKKLVVNNFCNNFTIPNIITPNGDDLNDWFIINNLVPNCNLTVFNRAGIIVYQNGDYQNNWQGEKLPDGNYYYVLRNVNLDKVWKGWIEIIH